MSSICTTISPDIEFLKHCELQTKCGQKGVGGIGFQKQPHPHSLQTLPLQFMWRFYVIFLLTCCKESHSCHFDWPIKHSNLWSWSCQSSYDFRLLLSPHGHVDYDVSKSSSPCDISSQLLDLLNKKKGVGEFRGVPSDATGCATAAVELRWMGRKW